MRTVLAIAGSDSCGGAGLQADIRTLAANGAHGACVVTAVTAQGPNAVFDVFPLPTRILRAQFHALLSTMDVAAAKSGVIGTPAAVGVTAEMLAPLPIPYVLDPVAIATSGGTLVSPRAARATIAQLFPIATLITPNAPEAAALTGMPVRTRDEAAAAGRALLGSGCGAVLVKGGHLEDDEATDVLVTLAGVESFASGRLANHNTHGTGCTLASAIAAHLSQGKSLRDAVVAGRMFVHRAIEAGYPIGSEPGPVDQLFALRGASPTGTLLRKQEVTL